MHPIELSSWNYHNIWHPKLLRSAVNRAKGVALTTITGLLPHLLWAALYLISQSCPGAHLPSLLVLLVNLGNSFIKKKYTCYKYFQACLFAISEGILLRQLILIHQSPCFALMVDGSTDLSTQDHLLIYIKYLVPGSFETRTEYLCTVRLKTATAECTFTVIMKTLEVVFLSKVSGFSCCSHLPHYFCRY